MMRLPVFLVLGAIFCCLCVTAHETVQEIYSYAGEKHCHPNGQLEFVITQYTGNRQLDDIKGVGMKFNDSRTYDTVDGKWYDEDYSELRVLKKGEPSIFVSNESLFDKPGPYTILLADMNISEKALMQLNYYTGENLLEDGSGLSFEINCSEIRHLCKPANLHMTCNNTGSGFQMVFSGIAGTNIDVNEDLEFMLDYRVIGDKENYVGLPNESTIHSIGGGSFRVDIPARAIELPVTRVKLMIKDCNHKLYNTSVLAKCAIEDVPPLNSTASVNATKNTTGSRIDAGNKTSIRSAMPDLDKGEAQEEADTPREDIDSANEQPHSRKEPTTADDSMSQPQQTAEPQEESKSWFIKVISWFSSLFSRD
jgi:hypothetical protein